MRRTRGPLRAALAPHITAAKAGGRFQKGQEGPPRGTSTTPTPSSYAAVGTNETAAIAERARVVAWERPQPAAEEATTPLCGLKEMAFHFPTAAGKAPRVHTRRGPDLDGTLRMNWGMTQVSAHQVSGMDPRDEVCSTADLPEDHQAEDQPDDHRVEDHVEVPETEDAR